MPVGVMVTLRGDRMYEFLDRLVTSALPRVRDFQGISSNGFDGRGNYTLGIKEQIAFPEISIDKVLKVTGMDITFVTNTDSDEEALTLLTELGLPFNMSKKILQKRSINQKIGIQKRFPELPNDIIKSSWSGIVSRTRNSSQIFEKIDCNIFAVGCYNGSGIGVGTLFGEQIALKAISKKSRYFN